MDDPGETTPRKTAPSETRTDVTQLASSRISDRCDFADGKLPLSVVTGSVDSPLTVSTQGDVDDGCSRTLKNPRACLAELPNELLIHIFKYMDGHCNKRHLACLSRTSKNLKRFADELLYKTIRITDGLLFPKILTLLEKNASLAMTVKSLTLEPPQGFQQPKFEMPKILDTIPNIQSLTIIAWQSYMGGMAPNPLETLSTRLLNYFTLRELSIQAGMSLENLRLLLSLPFLETLDCRQGDIRSSPEDWKPLVPKSKVRSLTIDEFCNVETTSQIISSVESLEHFSFDNRAGCCEACKSWQPIMQSLAMHEASLESLEIVHNDCIDFRTASTFKDFLRLHTLKLNLDYGLEKLPDSPSLRSMLPERLRKLCIASWYILSNKVSVPYYYEELLSLQGHNSLKSLRIDLLSGPLTLPRTPPTQLRLSTVVDTLQKAIIQVEVWKEEYPCMVPVVGSLRDWEDALGRDDYDSSSDAHNEENTSDEEDSETGRSETSEPDLDED